MNNFSQKDMLSIEDILNKPSLKKCSDIQENKTQVSIAGSDETYKMQTHPSYQSWVQQNQGDELTTVTSEVNQCKLTQDPSLERQYKSCQLKNLQPGSVYFEGSIFRKQQTFISSWEKRYMALTSEKLFFFQDETKTLLLGCVYVKHLPVSIIQKDLVFQLSCNAQNQAILLKGISQIQNILWIQKMNDVIEFCKGQRKVQIRKFNRSIYEQKDFILQEYFLETAQTGDLLLVSSDNSASYLQKFLTHSEFNHVAMIFKYKDQLKIFEANEQDGVSIYDWKQYLQIFKDHKRFAWRKLISNQKEQFQSKLKELVKKYVGRSYNISTAKLLRRTSLEHQDQQDRQFFCSQIVAKLYKGISLLDQQISSVRYWPITFTSRGQLNLTNGAYLSSERNILLSKHLKL